MASTVTPKFRIDVDIHNLLMNSESRGPLPAEPKNATLPEPVFPQYPELLKDPGPETVPLQRDWSASHVWRSMRGWLLPYVRSRVMPGEFHPITAYLFVDYKCNLDCWYCWAFNNKVKGMSEDVAKRSIDWLHDHGCRVLAMMGGEPLLRPQVAHKIVKKTCQRHCFSTLNHNLGYCYNDARVVKWVWTQVVTNRMKGGARSFED